MNNIDLSEAEIDEMSCRFCGEKFIKVLPPSEDSFLFTHIRCPNYHITYHFVTGMDLSNPEIVVYYRLNHYIELTHELGQSFEDDPYFSIIVRTSDLKSGHSIDIPCFDLDNLSLEQILNKVQMYIVFS